MRVFVGLPLDDEGRRGIRKVMERLERGHWPVRWVDEERWHATAAFLGETDQVDKAAAAVEKGCSGMKPFEVRFKGLGCWPDLLLPKIVWMGLKGDLKSMYRLVKGIRWELERTGIEFDVKRFEPHITLGRIKPEMGRKQRLELGRIIKKNLELEIPQSWWVDRVRVYQSSLKKSGAEYQTVKEFSLTE